MDAEAHYVADRAHVRTLLRLQPTWSQQDYAAATQRSLGWVKQGIKRLWAVAPDDDLVLHSRSRARLHPPPPLDPRVIATLLAIRDYPPEHVQRTPGPTAILYDLGRDTALRARGLRLPRSTRTVWQILRQHGRIALPSQRRHTPVDRPAPMSAWQLDFTAVTTVPADPAGKRQPVVDVLTTVDVGSSHLVNAQAREDFTAETTGPAIVATFRAQGLPESVTLDRDPRFVGSPHGRDFPAPLIRMLHCLGVQVTMCPPRRPDTNAFAERYNRTYAYECVRVYAPSDLETVRTVTAVFGVHYTYERPNQAVTCGNHPPCRAFSHLLARPPLPTTVDPDRWVEVVDGHRYVRKVRRNGTVSVAGVAYDVDQTWAGTSISFRLDAQQRSVVVEAGTHGLKALPIKGLVGEWLALDDYGELSMQEARSQVGAGRPIRRQLRLR